MSDAVTISLIGAFGSFAATAMSLLNNILGRRNERHLAETRIAINKLEENTNNKMDRLLETTGQAEFAKGKLEGAKGER